jgi:transposase-like protein
MPNNKTQEPARRSGKKIRDLSSEEIEARLKELKTMSDVTAFTKELLAPTIQRMLEAEMDDHLGYPKNHPKGNLSGNSRNGHYDKKVKTSGGEVNIKVPRDRNGQFEPLAVRKYETVESEVEERIVSMYAKGMTTADIKNHMFDIYGVEISKEMVSNITNKVLPLVSEWQNRPLSSIYPIVYLDAVHFKVRDSGKIVSKAAYTVLGINPEGKKEILGLWVGENEGAKFWMSVLNEIRNRGTEDILIACTDDLPGFSEAIKAVFPDTEIQKCVIHQIRNTTKYVSHKEKKAFCSDLRKIYTAPNEKAGLEALEEMKGKWKKYEIHLKAWERKWDELSTFFVYSDEIRKIIYTTNAVEGLHRQFRKVTKTTSVFPSDESLAKLLWLAQNDITRKWNLPVRNWGVIIGQLAIMFPERLKLN